MKVAHKSHGRKLKIARVDYRMEQQDGEFIFRLYWTAPSQGGDVSYHSDRIKDLDKCVHRMCSAITDRSDLGYGGDGVMHGCIVFCRDIYFVWGDPVNTNRWALDEVMESEEVDDYEDFRKQCGVRTPSYPRGMNGLCFGCDQCNPECPDATGTTYDKWRASRRCLECDGLVKHPDHRVEYCIDCHSFDPIVCVRCPRVFIPTWGHVICRCCSIDLSAGTPW